MGDNIRLGRVAGFPVAVNWSVLVLLWLFTWSLSDYTLPQGAPGHSPAAYWFAGLVGGVLLLASLLAHELAHALVARRAGVEVKGLTLWLFGGVANLGGEARTPAADLRIAIVGPATSLGLAAGFGATAVALDGLGIAHLVVSVAWWLSGINLMLGLFNLVPGAPLDGGRVLRAVLWRRTGDRARAAIGAARAGRVVAFGLVGLGLVEFLAGGGLGGLWLVFLGWFLLTAARAEETDVLTRQLLAGVRVGDVMSSDPVVGPAWFNVDAFVDRYVLGNRHSAYPVAGTDGEIQGLVDLDRLRAVLPADRETTRVSQVAIPLSQVPTATPEEPLEELLGRLSPATRGRALVFGDGRLVGILTPTDVARAIEIGRLRTSASRSPSGHSDSLPR